MPIVTCKCGCGRTWAAIYGTTRPRRNPECRRLAQNARRAARIMDERIERNFGIAKARLAYARRQQQGV